MSLAVMLGRFIGAMLAECGPVLAEILSSAIRSALENTAEDSKPDADLRSRLLQRLQSARNADSVREGGRPDPNPANDQASPGVGK